MLLMSVFKFSLATKKEKTKVKNEILWVCLWVKKNVALEPFQEIQ